MRLYILILFVMLMSLGELARAEDPVYFADPVLKTAVEETLNQPDPTPTQMLNLTTLKINFAHLQSLTGLEYATNLQYLEVHDNRISSIAPLSGLTNITHLDLNNNIIRDLSPLTALVNVKWLDLHDEGAGSTISDLSPLAGMTQLEFLHMYRHPISDISVLAGLTNLKDLDISDNQISDISPLSNLTKLKLLNLEQNSGISDLSALSGLTNLEELGLQANQVSDISALAGLTKLKRLYFSGNQIRDISAFATLTQLNILDLNNNRVRDITPLLLLTHLDDLDLRENPLCRENCDVYIPELQANNSGLHIQYDPCRDCSLGGVSYCSISIVSTDGGSVIAPGEGTFNYLCGGKLFITAEADPSYEFIGWTGVVESLENPVEVTVGNNSWIQANFMPLAVSPLTELYVDQNGPADPGPLNPDVSDPNEDGTMAHPFDRIQEAIAVASEGASIIVGPGTYDESIDFVGKSIHVLGLDPNLSGTSAYPVLQGDDVDPVVSFVSGEDANSVLSGFVVTGGRGAIRCRDSGGILSHCLIVGNRSADSLGVVDCNSGYLRMLNCTMAHNTGGIRLVDSGLELINSIVWGNVDVVDEIALLGSSFALISYSNAPTVSGLNMAGEGNLFSDPLFVRPGYWVNTDWQMGDYHLQSEAGHWDALTGTWMTDAMSSPCIDSGDPNSVVGFEPEPNGGIINMGAYGGTGTAGKSSP